MVWHCEGLQALSSHAGPLWGPSSNHPLCGWYMICSIPSLSSIFKHFDYEPNSVGYLSESLQDYGRSVPSTLSMPHQKVVFYLSDEIFAIRAPSWSRLMRKAPPS